MKLLVNARNPQHVLGDGEQPMLPKVAREGVKTYRQSVEDKFEKAGILMPMSLRAELYRNEISEDEQPKDIEPTRTVVRHNSGEVEPMLPAFLRRKLEQKSNN